MLTAIHVLLPVLAVASAASLPEAVKWGSHDTPFSAALTLARATKRGCATGGAVLDVGARGGEQTFEALHHGFKVVAIECMANEYWNLHSMWLQQPNVTLLHLCAASPEQEGVMMLYNAEGATTLHPSTLRHYAEMARHRHADRRTEPVVALPLDKLFWRQRGADVFEPSNSVPAPLCALKLDIQGAEVSALHGLARTVAHYKPVVYVEYDHRLVKDLARGQRPRAWLERLGYSCVPDDSRESNLTTVEFAAADGIGAAGRVTAEYGAPGLAHSAPRTPHSITTALFSQ